MTQYVVSPRAQRDIEEIWDYTTQQWSSAQAERYIRPIQEAIETIVADSRRGRSCESIRPNYRKFSVGSHLIFYRWTPDSSEIDVVRVLHQRMDFERHL
jgi:toxin ParE1/3/4